MHHVETIVNNFTRRTIGMIGSVTFSPRKIVRENVLKRFQSSISSAVNHPFIAKEVSDLSRYLKTSNFDLFPQSSGDYRASIFKKRGVSEIFLRKNGDSSSLKALFEAPFPLAEQAITHFERCGFKVYAQSDLRTVVRDEEGNVIKPGDVNLRFSYLDLYVGGDNTSVGIDYILNVVPANVEQSLKTAKYSLVEAVSKKEKIERHISLKQQKAELERHIASAIAQRARYETRLKNLPNVMAKKESILIAKTRNDEELKDAKSEARKIEKKTRENFKKGIEKESIKIKRLEGEIEAITKQLDADRDLVKSISVKYDNIYEHYYTPRDPYYGPSHVQISFNQLNKDLEEINAQIRSLNEEIKTLEFHGYVPAPTTPLIDFERDALLHRYGPEGGLGD